MRKEMVLIGFVCFLAVGFVVPALADETAKPKVLYGEYVSGEDFTVNFWMEKFEGGGPGKEGNELFAAGQGFIFKDGTLAEVTCEYPAGTIKCTTTYIGGELLLNSDGPWIKKEKQKQGKLRATDITAINESTLDSSTGDLNFTLTFNGAFDNDDKVCFSVIAEYEGNPTFIPNDSNPILQKDDHFTKITIDIAKCHKSGKSH